MNGETLLLLMILSPLAVFGAYYLVTDFIWRLLGYSRVIVLEKDGTHTAKWVKAKSKKEKEVDGKNRAFDPRGRFIGPLGNLFIFVGDNTRPLSITGEENNVIDTEDVSTMVRLSYFAGKFAGAKMFQQLQMMMYLNLVAVAMVGILLAMYWQDRQQLLQGLKQALVMLKSLATTHP